MSSVLDCDPRFAPGILYFRNWHRTAKDAFDCRSCALTVKQRSIKGFATRNCLWNLLLLGLDSHICQGEDVQLSSDLSVAVGAHSLAVLIRFDQFVETSVTLALASPFLQFCIFLHGLLSVNALRLWFIL